MLCVRFVFAHMTTYACRSFGLLGTLPRRQATGGGMQYRYTYYDNGRLKEKQASGRTLLAYAYDLSGNVVSRRDLTGKETCYGYDRCGRLKSVTDNGRVLAAYTYHGDGRVESRTIADTIRTDFRYDADKNLTHMKTVDMTAQGRKLVWEEYPAYDHNGNMVEKRNLEGTTRYAYDANNQLVEVSYPGAGGLLSERFGYDKAGNRLTRERHTADSIIMETYRHDNCNRIKELNRRTYEPDGVTPKLKKSPAVSNNPDAVASYIGETSYFGYDRSGNLLSDGSATYTYDGFGRTAEVKMADGSTQINRYDAEGLRAEMGENGQLVKFLFNEEREVIAEETDDGVIRYIRGLGIISSDSESARTYYHYVSDNQGSVRLILTDTANDRRIRNYYCYDAFGESVISHEDVHNRFRFNGEQYDPITSQYYLRARFYNPIIGRFTQEDTYYGDGLNLYEYCRNNPILYRDPSGHDTVNQKSLYGSNTLQTGGRQIDYNAYIKRLETIDMEYENIRMDTTDISKIAQNTGMPEWKISKIKKHVFFNEHILDSGKKRFDSDPEIADAWYRLTNGTYNKNDISLLNHEYFESKFEGAYKTDYRTAHNKTEESGRIWDPYKEEN